jgi:hypothetical protein
MKFLKWFGAALLLGFSWTAFSAAPVYYGILTVGIKVPYKAVNQTFKLLFYAVNNSTQRQTLSDFKFAHESGPNTGVKLKSITNSCNGVLAGQGSVCNIFVTVMTQGNPGTSHSHPAERYRFSMRLNASGGRGSILSAKLPTDFLFATGKLVSSANRTLTFKNFCAANKKLYVGLSGGAVNSIKPAISGKLTTCNADADCYPGSKCISTLGQKQCFSINPIPKNTANPSDAYFLAPGKTITAKIPTYDNGVSIIWSGGFAGRGGCVGNQCQTADCGGVSAGKVSACKPGQGFKQPVTMTEYTFESEGNVITATGDGNTYTLSPNSVTDTYDITNINGISFASISVTPNATPGGTSNPYNCGVPGNKLNKSGLGKCTWKFTPPSNDYVWVAFNSGASSCTTDSDCTSPAVCGMSIKRSAALGARIKKRCGIPLGYWTADAVCAADPGNNTPLFPCTDPIQGSLTYADLWGCSKGELKQSCYNVKNTTCCGCVNWNTVANITVPYPPTVVCKGKNPIWQTHSQSRIEWVKRGCPTAYTYPYDDKSSTFTCQKLNKAKINSTSYVITFCPQNS